jgi:mRNA-degrading endonuclease RelE of RelBE toxin-antitoxin system
MDQARWSNRPRRKCQRSATASAGSSSWARLPAAAWAHAATQRAAEQERDKKFVESLTTIRLERFELGEIWDPKKTDASYARAYREFGVDVEKLKESIVDDLRWFDKKNERILLDEAERILAENPLAVSRNMKSLRPNRVAQRERRLFGKYRVLFNVDEEAREVVIVLIGEKRGEKLIVRGEEYTAHHESDPSQ